MAIYIADLRGRFKDGESLSLQARFHSSGDPDARLRVQDIVASIEDQHFIGDMAIDGLERVDSTTQVIQEYRTKIPLS